MNLTVLRCLSGLAAAACAAGGASAQVALKSPWDLHPVKVTQASFSCGTPAPLPKDIVASDFYSDAKHSIIDPVREAAYKKAQEQFDEVTRATEKAADDFQKTGSAQAATCVVQLLAAQAQVDAMTGSMSTNQAQYVQNWTMGALAISYLKVRNGEAQAPGTTAAQTAAIEAWLRTVGQQVEAYFQERREKKTKDGQNNHLYWAGFSVMAAGIASNDHKLYDWGVGTYEDGVGRIADDGTLPLEMDRGQRALHYHLFALAPLVTMAEMGEANGQDLYSYDHNKLHLLVSRALSGLIDNHFFTDKAGVKQDTPDGSTIKPNDVDWAVPYARRFPDPLISSLLQRAGLKPYGYLGGLPPS
jgi:poly(beta-D-mannuronate) lyase